MKTLKITLLAAVVVLLTLSVVSSNSSNQNEDTTVESPSKIDLLAHKKKNIKLPEVG